MPSANYHFSKFLATCFSLSECRDRRGLKFPVGLMIFALTLCEAAGKLSQRSKAIWLHYHWSLICTVWIREGGEPSKTESSPSQSCISRFLSKVFCTEFYEQVDSLQRKFFLDDLKKIAAMTIETNATKAAILSPQYCVDGKSREGCQFGLDGRTEIDLTIYSPETGAALVVVSLDDKQGERAGLEEILENQMDQLPAGIITADAGITGKDITRDIICSGNDYLLQLKGNAGAAFEEVRDLPWEDVKHEEIFSSRSHGREEIKTLKAIDCNFLESPEFLDEYEDAAILYRQESWVLQTSNSKVSHSTRFFIGSSAVAEVPLKSAFHLIKNHWQIESFHWRKDAVMFEDKCKTKASNASRVLGRMRSFVDYVGRTAVGSTKYFIDAFAAAPQLVALN